MRIKCIKKRYTRVHDGIFRIVHTELRNENTGHNVIC